MNITSFDPTKPYTCRYGGKAEIICSNLDSPRYPLAVRYTDLSGEEMVSGFTKDGRYCTDEIESDYDLVNVGERITFTTFPLMALCVLVGATVITFGGWQNIFHHNKPHVMTIDDDWVMGSPTAVSNAMYFGVSAPGYTVGYATNHTFCPMKNGVPLTYNSMIRPSYWQAMVGTWREYEVQKGIEEAKRK